MQLICLTVKPSGGVVAFPASMPQHRIHREWLLNLLSDGLRTSLDFHICEKRNVFNSLFIHYVSCLSTPQEKVAILRTLNSAVKIKSTACTLYEHALLTWVSNVIEESDLSDLEVLKNLCAVVESLEANIPDHFYFTTILWKLIPKVKFLDVCAIKSLISTLLKSLSVMKNSNNSDWSKYRISAANMNQLYEVWNSLIKKLETKKNALMEDEISFETSKINECLPIFAKISIFWEPMLNEDMPEEFDLPIWLHKCAKTDTKHGLVKRKDSGLPRLCGLSFKEIGSRVGRNQTTIMRICDRWMQEGTTDRCGRSHPPQCTPSCEDRQIVRMAVTDRSVTSRTVAQHIESVTHHLVSARTVRRRLQQSGLSARRLLLGLPLTQNHRCLRRQLCDERRMWATEWNEVVFTDESRICLQHHVGQIRVWRHRGERMLNSYVMHHHGPA
ncbi:transposable element Tcb1 transposase [Trichonephila clavipes]|nr:transposable element Tcb1 transposase [Trichonephila clavipes]